MPLVLGLKGQRQEDHEFRLAWKEGRNGLGGNGGHWRGPQTGFLSSLTT